MTERPWGATHNGTVGIGTSRWISKPAFAVRLLAFPVKVIREDGSFENTVDGFVVVVCQGCDAIGGVG